MEGSQSIFLTSLYLLLSATLVFLNACFVAAEFSIVKVRRTRLQELASKGIRSARISLSMVDHLDEYLSATQLGITLVSLGLGWIGEESVYSALVFMFPNLLSEAHGAAHVIAAVIAFFSITFLHVVLGELVPKNMAIQNAEKIALRISPPLKLFYKCTRPVIRSFSSVANWVLRVFRYNQVSETPASEEELKIMITESEEEGVISESEAQIISKAFSFSDKRAVDIMVPVDQVAYLSLSRSFAENMKVARQERFTRFPLVRTDLQEVIGIVHMKDVIHHGIENRSNEVFRHVARSPLYVDRDMTEDQILKLFKKKRAQVAIVKDPGDESILGLVTLEDVVVEILGDFRDEHGN